MLEHRPIGMVIQTGNMLSVANRIHTTLVLVFPSAPSATLFLHYQWTIQRQGDRTAWFPGLRLRQYTLRRC